MLKIGIIGYGKMGMIREKTVEDSEHATVKSIYEPGRSGDKYVASPEHIFSDDEIDAIFISTPNYLNAELTIKAMENNKHVFCEKPPALTSAQLKEVRSVEEKYNRKLMYGFNHRHHASVKTMKSLIDSEEYGKVLWMRGRYGKSVDKSFSDNWRSKKELAGGGILMDQGIHMVDLFLHLGGSFDKINAFVSNLYWNLEVEDNVFAILKNSQTGVVASLHSTMSQWRHLFSIEIFLEKGYLVLNGLKTSSNSYGDEILTIAKNRSTAPAATWKDEERVQYHTDKSWSSEAEHFLNCIVNDTQITQGTSSEALELMDTLERIYASDEDFSHEMQK